MIRNIEVLPKMLVGEQITRDPSKAPAGSYNFLIINDNTDEEHLRNITTHHRLSLSDLASKLHAIASDIPNAHIAMVWYESFIKPSVTPESQYAWGLL